MRYLEEERDIGFDVGIGRRAHRAGCVSLTI